MNSYNMNSTGCSNVIAKLFSGAQLDEETLGLIQSTIESQINSDLDGKVLNSISKFLTKVPEETFKLFESSAIATDSKESVQCVRFPTLISELTDGGRLSVSNKIKLGNYVKAWYFDSHTITDKRNTKVLVDTKSMKNGRVVKEKIAVLKYTRHDLIYLIVLIWKFITTMEAEIAY
ncbi:hypothetical protein QKC54_gp1051 [Megavirus baoshan]|uniref:Uncharacterized protein n=1 Tax=Megavirus baoshan TaxID=2496520 RepID=A0A8K1T280_9VIRU|nr:hypothetical protein QKC54_gp1051 [Megavirus baoshan]UFX99712.1 hypothetical protein Mb0021 [Megavirus baoshan]